MIGFDGGGRAISLMAALSVERFSLMAVVEQFHWWRPYQPSDFHWWRWSSNFIPLFLALFTAQPAGNKLLAAFFEMEKGTLYW
jgi:hypothetical protein